MLHIKLRYLRESYELKQKQLADFLNIERSTYSYYESGKIMPDISSIAKLSDFYLVSCDYLIKNNIKRDQLNNVENLLNKTCPKECEFLFYFRMLPLDTQNQIIDILKSLVKNLD